MGWLKKTWKKVKDAVGDVTDSKVGEVAQYLPGVGQAVSAVKVATGNGDLGDVGGAVMGTAGKVQGDVIDKVKDKAEGKIESSREEKAQLEEDKNNALDEVMRIFDEQMAFLKERQELSDSYREAAEAILENSPNYEIPNVITELTGNLKNTANAVRNNYNQASDDLKNTVQEGISRSLETYATGLNDAIVAVQTGGDSGLRSFKAAYSTANDAANDILNIGQTGFDSMVKMAKVGGDDYKQIVEEGITPYLQGADASASKIRQLATQGTADSLGTAQKGFDETIAGLDKAQEGYDRGAESIREQGRVGAEEIKSASQKGLDTTISGLDDALRQYETGATTIRDLYKQTLSETGESSDKALMESLEGSDKMVSIFRDLARGEMPGQSLLEGKLDQQSAEALSRIKNLSGGRGGLSAIAETYQNKQEGYQDIAIQAAQYKNKVKQDLANAYQVAGQSKSGAYSDQFNRSMSRGQFGIGAEQAATDMDAGSAERIALEKGNAYLNDAQMKKMAAELGISTEQLATEMSSGSQERIALQKGNAYMSQAELQMAAAQMGMSAEQLANSITSESQLNSLKSRLGASEYATNLNLGAEEAKTTGMMNATATASGMKTDALTNLGQYNRQIGLDEANQLTTNAEILGSAEERGYQNMGNAIVTGANMVNQGQMQSASLESEAANTMAGYEDQQFQYNEWQPYQNKLNYNTNMALSTDPTNAMMNVQGDKAGVNLAIYQGAMNQQAANKAANAQLWGSLLGTAGRVGMAFI